jgi:arylsulfatase A-like enzyme
MQRPRQPERGASALWIKPAVTPGVTLALALAAGALLLASAGLGACSERAPRARNVILISVDTLRADRLGCYGYGRPTTPFLDRQARAGVLFEDATATSSWTYPSHASMFTGLYPGRNGATELEQRMRPAVASLAEWLAARGFRAEGVVSSTLFLGYGLERGFEKLEYVEPGGVEPSHVTAKALEWLAAVEREKPFFFLVHYLDPHSDYGALPEFEAPFHEPYEGPATGKSAQLFEHIQGLLRFTPADARHLSNLYDAGVRQQDAELEKLFAALEREGLLADTLVLLTSDHGEEFLEHGGVMHGLAQYEESVRVPLVLWGPDLPAGVRVADGVSLVDLMPTVLDVLGLPAPAGLDGVSLRALWESPGATRAPRALFVEADMDPPGPTARRMVPGDDLAVRRGRHKLVLDPKTGQARLYDLTADPAEAHDVAGQFPELVGELEAELARFRAARAAPAPGAPLDEEDMKRLEALGYAGKKDE